MGQQFTTLQRCIEAINSFSSYTELSMPWRDVSRIGSIYVAVGANLAQIFIQS